MESFNNVEFADIHFRYGNRFILWFWYQKNQLGYVLNRKTKISFIISFVSWEYCFYFQDSKMPDIHNFVRVHFCWIKKCPSKSHLEDSLFQDVGVEEVVLDSFGRGLSTRIRTVSHGLGFIGVRTEGSVVVLHIVQNWVGLPIFYLYSTKTTTAAVST